MFDRSEYGSLKSRPVFDRHLNPSPHKEWVSQEFTKWSKGFADHNQWLDDLSVLSACYMFTGCKQKDRILAATMFISHAFYLDHAMENARKQRSATLMVDLFEKLLLAVLTGRTDNDFCIGRRLLDTLAATDAFLTRDQMTFTRNKLNAWLETIRDIHCNYWLQNRFIPYDQYYDQRSNESGWYIYTLFSEICSEYTAPESLLKCVPSFDTLRTTGIQLALALDDYLMTMVKLATNDITNGVLSYASAAKCSVQTALDVQLVLIKGLESECRSLYDTMVDRLGPGVESQELKAYFDTFMDSMYGFHTAFAVLYAYEEKDGLVWSPKWEALSRQLMDDTKEMQLNFLN
ncbi:unnamed protein product [Medioppia subpectinata]|uniref:Terpene synthase n=1 Tax=Medioppia subpectinata TaxID=1979941 RepID=A0A7R9Q167_9ACAR|nr:unnamed protein product [Medioppia subpectinata]CAG2108759.1 unnamed protein product [Medioppia subpectinata]